MRSSVIAVGSSTHRNRIGRVYSLWLTARAAGLGFRYITVDDGPLWPPLRAHADFLADVQTGRDLDEVEQQVLAACGPESVVLVCKPRPELVRLGRRLAASHPVVVDIDDPELLDPWGTTPITTRAKRIVRNGPIPFRFGWTRRAVSAMEVTTSNPTLQALYGGEVVPHVREPAAAPSRAGEASGFVIGFIGTTREHKGIGELRAAVAALARARADVRLCITASPPHDAAPWEEWVGATSIEGGRALLERCDAVAVVSRPGEWGDHQLPVKLVDAMASGVPAVITPRAPMLWAAAGSALVVRDDAVSDLRDAFALLADDPGLARELGTAGWRRARSTFAPEAAAPHLVRAIERAEARLRASRP